MIKPISNYPHTVTEAVDNLMATLPPDQLKEIADMSEDDLFQLHFGLGLTIRNNFGFYDGNEELIDNCMIYSDLEGYRHVDNCSSIIAKKLWGRLKQ